MNEKLIDFDRLKQLVKELTQLNGNVGYEDEIIRYICTYLKNKADDIKVDSIGNVTALFSCGQDNAKRVMFFAHMDEVGLVVRKIEDNGLLRIEKLGSVNPTILQGSYVEINGQKGMVTGVIGAKSHHLLQADDKKRIRSLEELYVDIGADSIIQVNDMGIDVGTPITMKGNFSELANHMVANKAMDDRGPLAMLLYLADHIIKEELLCDLYLVFSVQEEFNTRGIMPVVREIIPDIAIGIDVTPACDLPDTKHYSRVAVGKGVGITYMNHHSRGTLAGLAPNIRFIRFLETICNRHCIPFQKEVATGVLTETAYILFENSKTVVCNLSIPTRYTHTPIEVLSLEDLFHCYHLLMAFLAEYHKELEFRKSENLKEINL